MIAGCLLRKGGRLGRRSLVGEFGVEGLGNVGACKVRVEATLRFGTEPTKMQNQKEVEELRNYLW